MRLPGPYAALAHSWGKALIIDAQSRVHFAEALKADVWTRVPDLDGAFDLATSSLLGEACGLFPDGRVTCVDRL
jgi:hypothetical protein